MSIARVTYLYCDGPLCKDDTEYEPFDNAPVPGETVAEQRERAKAQGWRHRKGNDYCPECSTPQVKEPEK